MKTNTKTAKKADYNAICTELGFRSEIHFVTIERGRIGFTCGKPQELRALAYAARQAGYAITKNLARLTA